MIFFIGFLCLAACLAPAQQPNLPTSGLIMNYCDGGPAWPIVAEVPNGGLILGAVYGTPGAPYGLLVGEYTLPGAAFWPSVGILDLGGNVEVFAQTFSNGLPGYVDGLRVPDNGGQSHTGWSPGAAQMFLPFLVPTGIQIVLPAVQGLIVDPITPLGFTFTAAVQLTMKPTPGILFLQGVQNPFGFGNQARLADTSFLGFSNLKLNLQFAGFPLVDELEHTASRRLTAADLVPYKVLVLGSNRTAFTIQEVNLIETFVRNGGGLLVYADSLFAVDPDPANPGNYISSCDAFYADNQVLSRFGLEVLPDNFASTSTVSNFLFDHPIVRGLPMGFEGEGMSFARVIGGTVDSPELLADCISNSVGTPGGGCSSSAVSSCVSSGPLAICEAGLGRVALTFDRNTFLNPPGFGTHLYRASNLIYAVNLFTWTAGLN